jgi:hypothetical protein
MLKLLRKAFGAAPDNPPEGRVVPNVVFLAEQDGPIERQLKDAWLPVLVQLGVPRAYLVRAQLPGETGSTVALAMPKGGYSEPSVVKALTPVFKMHMAKDTFIDMLFVDAKQESTLVKVCKSFVHAV